MGQRMTRCVFLCFMSFLCFFKLEKKQETVFYDICLETSLKKCMSLCDYVVSPHRDCIRHSMCFCAFVFFFFPKNTKTQWPNVSLSFFNNRIAPDSLCVFVFLCFFFSPKKHKKIAAFFCLFTREPMCFCVFVFFLRKSQEHNDHFFLLFFQQ